MRVEILGNYSVMGHVEAGRSGHIYGAMAILLAVGFNIPYVILMSVFDYPKILDVHSQEILRRFSAGGEALVLCWYAFTLSALALTVVAPGLAISRRRLETNPALAVSAAVSGMLAGVTQTIGLSRWVFAVPALAVTPDDPVAQLSLEILNIWAGGGIGAHIGQLLMASFIAQTALLQWQEGQRIPVIIGCLTAVLLILGAMGYVLSHRLTEIYALLTGVAFAGVTLWLIVSGGRLTMKP